MLIFTTVFYKVLSSLVSYFWLLDSLYILPLKEEKTSKFLIKKSKFLILCIKDAQTTIFFKKKCRSCCWFTHLTNIYWVSTVPALFQELRSNSNKSNVPVLLELIFDWRKRDRKDKNKQIYHLALRHMRENKADKKDRE